MRSTATQRHIRLLALAIAAALLTACSADKRHFDSTTHLPVTYRLLQTSSQEVVWEYPVPTLHRLTVNLEHPREAAGLRAPNLPPDRLVYSVKDRRTGRVVDRGEVALPGLPVIESPVYRAAPEPPPQQSPPDAG